jgi:glycerol-3-phosphate dehydrogenase
VAEVAGSRIALSSPPRLRLVKGSHIVVSRLDDLDKAYVFQNADRRVVFAIPYEGDFTLIGTTDVDFAGDPSDLAIGEDETAYLCAAANVYLARPISPSDVVWSYAGVRALADDDQGSPQDTSGTSLIMDRQPGAPPLLNVVGGKITTYRHVAEEVLRRLAPDLPGAAPPWTRSAPLPGGDLGGRSVEELATDLAAACPPLGRAVARRLAASYGTMARDIIAGVERESNPPLAPASGAR